MPLYEYRCPNNHDFEKFFRSMGTATAQAECPVCGELGERRISAAGLVFKGSGFYITDYGKDGKKAEREAATASKKSDVAGAASSSSESGADTASKSDSATQSSAKSSDSAPAKEPSTKAETPKPTPSTTKTE